MDERITRDLESVIELFRKAELRDLVVRGPSLSLRLSLDSESSESSDRAALPRAAMPAAATPASRLDAPRGAAVSGTGNRPLSVAAAVTPIDPAWTAVTAPNLGTFYRSPKPGSPPFVEVGQTVGAGTEICLIEVMKLFTSVRTEIAGTVRHIAAADAQLVEGGQPLIYIEADA